MFHYKCERCEFSREMIYLPRVYFLPEDAVAPRLKRPDRAPWRRDDPAMKAGGISVPMTQRHGWCHTCNDISPFESLEREPSALEMMSGFVAGHERKLALALTLSPEEIAKLPRGERFSPEWEQQCLNDHREREEDWQRWRNLRKAPEKCLRCGSTDIEMPESDWCDLIHGTCGGTIVSTATIQSQNGPEKVPHLYSIDGDLLIQGERPVGTSLQFDYVPMELFWIGSAEV